MSERRPQSAKGSLPRPRVPLLVALEGIDGTGKSTLQRNLTRTLRRGGWRVATWREPSDTTLGQAARHFAGSDPAQAGMLFTLDRVARGEKLDRLLARVDAVISDRSYFSTLAYQGSALPIRQRRELEEMQRTLVRSPDLVIWLALAPAEALGRIRGRGGRRFALERGPVLTRTARAYAGYARRSPTLFARLEARLPPQELARRATDLVVARASRAPVE